MSPRFAKELRNLPKDFEEPFAVFLKDQVFLLWAQCKEEQEYWWRELKALAMPANYLEVNSTEFVDQYKQTLAKCYAYSLFQLLQHKWPILQETPRSSKRK